MTKFVVEEAEHNDFYDVGGKQIDEAIRRFVEPACGRVEQFDRSRPEPPIADPTSIRRIAISSDRGPRQELSGRDRVAKIPGRRPRVREQRSQRVQRGWWIGSTNRSGWGIRPKIRPVGSQTPATAPAEPLGLAG